MPRRPVGDLDVGGTGTVRGVLTVLAALVGLATPAVAAPTFAGPANVVVLANADVPESLLVADAYLQARGLSDQHLCALSMPPTYEIPLAAYEAQVKDPFAACLEAHGLREQALFVAVTWGVPGVISDAGEEVLGSRRQALDSFLADPFDELPAEGNPYHRRDEAFTRENGFRGYLVTRLDGPGWEVARDLVVRAVSAELAGDATGGVGYFDQEPHGDTPLDEIVIGNVGAEGNAAILSAHDLVAAAGWDTVLDANDVEFGTPPALEMCSDARWYFGWYRMNRYNDAFAWHTGAAGIHLDSFSAREFRKPGSWAAGALAAGITATAGAVWEPYYGGLIEGDTFLQAFVVDGVSLAEAAWRAIPRRPWMNVVFGDPLFSLTRTYEGTTLPVDPEAEETAPEEPAPVEPRAEPDTLPATSGSGGCTLALDRPAAAPWGLLAALVTGAACWSRSRRTGTNRG